VTDILVVVLKTLVFLRDALFTQKVDDLFSRQLSPSKHRALL